jgi:hypothetical protein
MSEDLENIVDKLERHPRSAYITQDSEDCKLLLAKAQMITEAPKLPTAGLLVGLGSALKTHWVISMIWSGYSSPKENGCQVICLSKIQYTDERLADFMTCLMVANKGRSRKNAVKIWT